MNHNTPDHTESTTDPGRPPLLMAHASSQVRPLLRVYTLGPLTLEWVRTATPFPAERLVSRGAAPSLLLLKALISRPHRYAARDWLCEHLHSAEEEALSPARLDDLASLLRGLLCPPVEDRAQRDRLRRELLTYVHSASESGPGYRLGSYPLIWVDIDALSWYVEQACRMERFGEDALSLWEQAYALAKRGEYLPDEPYSDWAEPRRAEAVRYLRQSVHALARLYLSQQDVRAEEEALRVLGGYWERHVTDEDALRPLMELLGKRERYQEALSYYERLCEVLEEEDRAPDARTTDLKEFLRVKQLQRSRALPQARGDITASIESLPGVHILEQPAWPPLPTHWQSVIPHHHMLNLLDALPKDNPDDQQLGAWLALAVNDLTALFNAGWTMEDVLDALHMTLQAVQDMPPVVRQKLFQLSSTALMGGIAQPAGDVLPAEEQTQLCISLGQNITESWRFFHTTKPSLMLAIAQVQLSFVKHVHTLLYPAVRPFFYAALYQLIGASLYLLSSFEQAYHALGQSYLAGLQVANAWHMAQSLSWQAYLWQERGAPSHALDAIDQALRLISSQDDLECLRLRARLLALSAEQIALMGDVSGTQERLQASEAFLASLSEPHEEFDAIGWLQQAGICALHLHDYPLAIQRLQCALDQIPSQWILRSIATAIPLAKALTQAKEVRRAIEVVQRTIPLIASAQASVFTRKFVTYLEQDLLEHFPDDKRCQRLVIEARQQLEKQWDSR